MRTRSVLAIVVAFSLLICLTGLLLVAYARREACISRFNFQRVQLGMTQTHVEALFGRPGRPLDEPDPSPPHTAQLFYVARSIGSYSSGIYHRPPEDRHWEYWHEGNCVYVIRFDGLIVECTFDASPRPLWRRVWNRLRR